MRTPSSLGAKLLLVMTVVGVIAAIAITLLLAGVITPSFTRLEGKAVAAHVERTRAAVSDYAASVESAARDYGDWNDGNTYPADPDTWLARENLDGIAYVTSQGRTVAARWSDPTRHADRADPRTPLPAPAEPAQLIAAIDHIDIARLLQGRRSGRFYARVGDRVAAIGVAQVRRATSTDGAPDYVLLARIIAARDLSARLQRTVRINLAANGDRAAVTAGRSMLTIVVPIIGANGHAVATVRLGIRRDVSLLGHRMLLLAAAGSTALLVLVLILLRSMIARLVLRPLRRIEAHMQRVRASGSLALLEDDGRRDEIGSLGRNFNAMLRQLNDLRGQIEVQSFDLGRSESTIAMMHNVRNALNPISTILSLGIAQALPSDRPAIDRAIAELAGDDVPGPRRRKLLAFVAAALKADANSREATRRDLVVGRESMAHVLEIIGQQQQAAHDRPALELCDVAAIIARNATIARYAQGASIAFSFPAGPTPVIASRVILSQVIGNLFGNAVESIEARGTGSGSIAATIMRDGEQVTIQIRDDGEGFAPDVAAALFTRGFSTRAHKSGGLGLHWCANSVNAMNGSLRLESDGPGLGAVAILTLQAGDAGLADSA